MGGTATTAGTIDVTVGALSDGPERAATDASGAEDTAIPLDIAAALTDTDGSETLSITVSGVPAGAVLSAGIDNGDGSWSVDPTALAGLTITPPANSDADFQVTVTATATEAATGETATSTATIDVAVNAVTDAPTLVAQDGSGSEDTAIALDIQSVLTDTDGSETLSITVSGVPEGAVLSAGTNNGDGSWTLAPADLEALTVTPAANSDADFQLTVTATAAEGATGETATETAVIDVRVNAVADAPELPVGDASGAEGAPVPLHLSAAPSDTARQSRGAGKRGDVR